MARRTIVRIVSANLGNGCADATSFADLMAQIRPDAVAVQEITPEQARALGGVLPFGGLSPSDWYVGMGIALRQPGRVRTVGLGYTMPGSQR